MRPEENAKGKSVVRWDIGAVNVGLDRTKPDPLAPEPPVREGMRKTPYFVHPQRVLGAASSGGGGWGGGEVGRGNRNFTSRRLFLFLFSSFSLSLLSFSFSSFYNLNPQPHPHLITFSPLPHHLSFSPPPPLTITTNSLLSSSSSPSLPPLLPSFSSPSSTSSSSPPRPPHFSHSCLYLNLLFHNPSSIPHSPPSPPPTHNFFSTSLLHPSIPLPPILHPHPCSPRSISSPFNSSPPSLFPPFHLEIATSHLHLLHHPNFYLHTSSKHTTPPLPPSPTSLQTLPTTPSTPSPPLPSGLPPLLLLQPASTPPSLPSSPTFYSTRKRTSSSSTSSTSSSTPHHSSSTFIFHPYQLLHLHLLLYPFIISFPPSHPLLHLLHRLPPPPPPPPSLHPPHPLASPPPPPPPGQMTFLFTPPSIGRSGARGKPFLTQKGISKQRSKYHSSPATTTSLLAPDGRMVELLLLRYLQEG
ncbi:hypothetical protein C7M84_020681 [Penaeus vannamei]|uniref:Uncharacterized protein n=1 Tax=Penaeus vannamei TaxID=6689 RepID=A0A423SBE5_PENVA|nr:hypothetical protein C7M84_020681 [Penaeus vannamei]